MEKWSVANKLLSSFSDAKNNQDQMLMEIYEAIEDDDKYTLIENLKKGANLDRSFNGVTPLIKGYTSNNYELTKYMLMVAGANPAFEASESESPIWLSLLDVNVRFFKLFTLSVSRIQKSKKNQLALIEAVKLKSVDIVRILLKIPSVKVNEKDGVGNTALHYAFGVTDKGPDDEEIIRMLIAAGADKNTANMDGQAPGDYVHTPEHSHDESLELADELNLELKPELSNKNELKNNYKPKPPGML